MTATADITIVRGTTDPDLVWRFQSAGQPFDGTGSVFVLTIKSGANTILKSTASDSSLTYDNATGRLRWVRTLTESRLIQPGRVGRYEIERRFGTGKQSFLVEGAVTGKPSLSDD